MWYSMADNCSQCIGKFLQTTDPRKKIIKNLEEIFKEINKHLNNLDNGGYMIEFDKKVVKLEDSDVVLQARYVDRMEEDNVTKEFNPPLPQK